MIRIGILGNIGSGKSYVANNFGYPVFNADYEVAKLYKTNKKIFIKLNKILPENIKYFPIKNKVFIGKALSYSNIHNLAKQSNNIAIAYNKLDDIKNAEKYAKICYQNALETNSSLELIKAYKINYSIE